MKKSLSLLTLVIVSATSLSISELQAGGGAGWGIAGGLIGASVIASAASRDRGDRVYVTNNYPASPKIVYDADGRQMIYNGQQFVYIQDNSQSRRDNRRNIRREKRDTQQDLRGDEETYEEAYE
jgi:hypothetical protein